MDAKLAVSLLLNAIAAATSYYDYRVTFANSKFWLAVGSATFLAIYAVWSVHLSLFALPVVFSGRRQAAGKRRDICVLTEASLADAVYRIKVVEAGVVVEAGAARVDKWMDERGCVAPVPFCTGMRDIFARTGPAAKDD